VRNVLVIIGMSRVTDLKDVQLGGRNK